MNDQKITIATANAHVGRLMRQERGLAPLQNSDVILLQEVDLKRDNLEVNLKRAGYKLAIAASDLAIAVRQGIKIASVMTFPLDQRRIIGVNHIMIAAEIEKKDGIRIVVVSAHFDVPLLPHARLRQIRRMEKTLKDLFFAGITVIGMDANHYPGPWRIDRRMRERSGFKCVSISEPTYVLAGSLYALLGKLGFPDGEMDAILYRGKDIREVGSRVVKVKSDHGAIETVFVFKKSRS